MQRVRLKGVLTYFPLPSFLPVWPYALEVFFSLGLFLFLLKIFAYISWTIPAFLSFSFRKDLNLKSPLIGLLSVFSNTPELIQFIVFKISHILIKILVFEDLVYRDDFIILWSHFILQIELKVKFYYYFLSL